MTAVEQQQAAKAFAAEWQGKGYEKGDTHRFWLELLQKVLGVEDPYNFISFEEQVLVDSTNFMDGYIPSTKVLIEQKSIEKDLGTPIKQSNGAWLNPYQQALKYIVGLPVSKHPRWVVTCNFREFWVYDMDRPNDEAQKILLKDLEKEYYRLQFLVDEKNDHLKREMEVSVKAGNLVGVIYDKLLEQYIDKDHVETLKSLNILCVRLVFCLYAEDAGLFKSKTAFHDYLAQFPASQIRRALIDLFKVLDTPIEKRDVYLEDSLKAFPYANGGLFSDENIIIPQFTEELKQLILEKASDDFDWSEISPTIFGAVFESTLNPETRRSGGMHYTSIENIHKVIDPLFLNDLNAEFQQILEMKQASPRKLALAAFQDKLAGLTFFDPACGSGNFLTETFLSLRRLENKVVQAMFGGENVLTFDILIKVNISQFYGIEINDFACTVAKTALWIAESQTLKETAAIAGRAIDFLPLKTNAYIHEGNALQVDWNEVIAPERLNYIIGNPPFIGARMKSAEQANDVLNVFGSKWKNWGNLDYVCCWYKKAADMMRNNSLIEAAFVSTNSITQGEQVANLWKPLFEQYGIHFDFAYRTFRWDSEADIKAHVHCVIIGFSSSKASSGSKRKIYLSDNQIITVSNINGYLVDAPNVWIESRNKPLCDAPEIGIGNKPIDGGNYLFSEEEMREFIAKEPKSAAYFHPFYGAYEFINQKPRYCLYLGNCSPAELRSMPLSYERVMNVREYRLQSPSAGTRKIADTPTHFHVENMPKGSYIVIPQVSSQRRRYIPMGYMDDGVLCSDKVRIMSEGQLYHFGILESNVHMAWMRTICCRLKSDYSYTINDVYNNFPWPNPTPEQKAKIEQTAQAILDARAKYPDSSLADLYDEVTMPAELRTAHQNNDRAVMAAYCFTPGKTSESECVAELFKMYQEMTK